MADHPVPYLHNDLGVERIRIGVKEFQCMGALPPHDHPHVFLDMGDDEEIVCPYCSTVFLFDPALPADTSDPPDCIAEVRDVAPVGRAAGHARRPLP